MIIDKSIIWLMIHKTVKTCALVKVIWEGKWQHLPLYHLNYFNDSVVCFKAIKWSNLWAITQNYMENGTVSWNSLKDNEFSKTLLALGYAMPPKLKQIEKTAEHIQTDRFISWDDCFPTRRGQAWIFYGFSNSWR